MILEQDSILEKIEITIEAIDGRNLVIHEGGRQKIDVIRARDKKDYAAAARILQRIADKLNDPTISLDKIRTVGNIRVIVRRSGNERV